jgi:hypothetical protein
MNFESLKYKMSRADYTSKADCMSNLSQEAASIIRFISVATMNFGLLLWRTNVKVLQYRNDMYGNCVSVTVSSEDVAKVVSLGREIRIHLMGDMAEIFVC